MTQEEKSAAIAKVVFPNGLLGESWLFNGEWIKWRPFSDLNAMREAEQSLWQRDCSLRYVFVDHLARILNPVHGYRMQDGVDLLDATAADRAEAFGLTLHLWTN